MVFIVQSIFKVLEYVLLLLVTLQLAVITFWGMRISKAILIHLSNITSLHLIALNTMGANGMELHFPEHNLCPIYYITTCTLFLGGPPVFFLLVTVCSNLKRTSDGVTNVTMYRLKNLQTPDSYSGFGTNCTYLALCIPSL